MDRAGLLALLAGALEGARPALSGRRSIRSDRPRPMCSVTVPAEVGREPRSERNNTYWKVLGASVDVVVDEPVGD